MPRYCSWKVPVYIVTSILKWVKRFLTVTAEKATKHIVDNITRNTPRSGTFRMFFSAFRYMKMCKILQELFYRSTSTMQCLFVFCSVVITSPYYLLVVPYAFVQLFLRVTEQFLRLADLSLSLSLLLICLSPTVLFSCDVCLSDIQYGSS
jgi:hypothetical protein